MRIAFVTFEYVTEPGFKSIHGHGGIATSIYRCAQALKDHGHEPIVIVASSSDEIIEHEGIQVYRVDVRSRWVNYLQRIKFIRKFVPAIRWIQQSKLYNKRLLEIYKTNPIDIIEYTSYAATGLFRLKNFPSVVRISSLQRLLEDGANKNKMFFLEKLENISFRKADKIIGPSIVAAKLLEKIINRNVQVIVWPFIPLKVAEDVAVYHDMLQSKRYLLFIGSIGLLKGIKTIADILPELFKKYKDLYFVFVGKDDFYNDRPMMNYVWHQSGKYRGRVIYLGILPHHQLFPIIRNSEAIVLPSRVDNLPNTLIEGMTMGKIVIGTRGASFDQLITYGENGFLCNRDDKKDLLEQIEIVLNLEYKNKKDIEQAAKERSKELAEDKIIPQLLNIYNEVINKFNSKDFIK